MNDENNTKTVNIRVNATDWENLSDENRSEICREALRSASQMKRDAGKALRYAGEYEKSLAKLDKAQAEVKVNKTMMENELEAYGYHELVTADELPDQFSLFEEMLVYSGKYANSYMEAGRGYEWIVNAIMQDMRDEGKVLPVGIAEWIVGIVEDNFETEDEDDEEETVEV
ncbi:hypothetical protein HUG10_20530 (plasmid) [Halorarum halophilum]|uniref:Uncharacterized protein n=1 Tax=Halorarum halophilum TaxID=2743090 RepID=A0A7D5KP82_9EURY|nr:hypothetical protein [Halobaculum halophilum]QLG29995.1 hypothetical protein HUG10_20530 [Halobaculum halophilum]